MSNLTAIQVEIIELIGAHNGKIVLHVSHIIHKIPGFYTTNQAFAENVLKVTGAKIKNEFIGIFTFEEVEEGEPKIRHLKAYADASAVKEVHIKEVERQENLKDEYY